MKAWNWMLYNVYVLGVVEFYSSLSLFSVLQTTKEGGIFFHCLHTTSLKVYICSPSRRPKISTLQHSFITFEYGPPELNLYKYVAEELSFLWRKIKETYTLKKGSEPLDRLILIQGDSENVQNLSMEHFDFDPETTRCNIGNSMCGILLPKNVRKDISRFLNRINFFWILGDFFI